MRTYTIKKIYKQVTKQQVMNYIFYNYGDLYSKTKDEIHEIFNKFYQNELKNV